MLVQSDMATWEWDGTDWRRRALTAYPPSGGFFNMAYDEIGQRMVLTRAADYSTAFGGWFETWVWDGNGPVGTFQSAGVGCPGAAGVPALDSVGGATPHAGRTFPMRFTNLPSTIFSPVIGVFGLSDVSSGGRPLPIDLSPLGMPGCWQYLDPLPGGLVLCANQSGTASWQIDLPFGTVWIGLNFYVQGLVLDPGANALGATVTNSCHGIIGG